MKIRHAAVLALAGWYLMMPPQTRFWWIGQQRYDDSASLSRWTIEQSFDKAEACQAARVAGEQRFGDAAVGMDHAVCVATGDPRLAT
jgi:hypothetical protein